MNVPGGICAVGRALLPVNMPLPKRHWRWLWLALVLRLVIGVPLFLIAIGPYLLCKGICLGLDRLGGLVGGVPVLCYNRDLAHSGWRELPRRGQPAQLSPDWAARIRPRTGS